MIAAVLVTAALAGPRPCTGAYDADDFVSWVDGAEQALIDDDLIAHGVWTRTIRDRVPCLEVPVPTDAWVTYLQGLALVEFHTGHDWRAPLTTALLLAPEDRPKYGPAPLHRFAPVLPEDGTEPLPSDAWYYVDGRRVTVLPALPGVHLIQREHAGVWEGAVITAPETFPDRWRVDRPLTPEPEPERPRWPLLAAAGATGVFATTAAISFGLGRSALENGRTAQYRALRTTNHLALAGTALGAVGVGLTLALP